MDAEAATRQKGLCKVQMCYVKGREATVVPLPLLMLGPNVSTREYQSLILLAAAQEQELTGSDY